MLLLTESDNKYFPYGTNSMLIRALFYTHTSKTTKSQCFPLLLWTEVQPVHTPVRTQAYGLALSQSNFSILSVFCLVYNNDSYDYHSHSKRLCLYSDRIRQRTYRVQRSTRNSFKKVVWRFYSSAHSCRGESRDESHCKIKR